MVNREFNIVEVGHPALVHAAAPVDDFTDPYLRKVIEAMEVLMEERAGVGIAATQLGVGLQMMIVASRPNPRYPKAPEMKPLLLINPDVLWQSPSTEKDWEGCLSIPGLRAQVCRPMAATVSYQSASGENHKVELSGFPARVFFHEYDHLIGKNLFDRIACGVDVYSEAEYQKRVGNLS